MCTFPLELFNTTTARDILNSVDAQCSCGKLPLVWDLKTMNVFCRNVAKYTGYLHRFKILLRSFLDFCCVSS